MRYEHQTKIISYLFQKARGSQQKIRQYLNRFGILLDESDRRLAALKDVHKGERAFIIGMGPSLKVRDLDKLKGEITFACNKVYLSFNQTDWRPSYYVVEDYLVAQQNHNMINSLQGFTKLFPAYMKESFPLFKDAIYFNMLYKKLRLPPFSFNALYRLYGGNTVVYLLIQLACFMGIREIYLIGLDFSFSIPQKTEKDVNSNYKVYISDGEINHFHPDYRKTGEKWYEPNLQKQEKAYMAAHKAIKQLGGQIFNATRGGKLEVFPRIDFDTLFEQTNG